MIVLTIGTFDLFHHGHLRLLRQAGEIGYLQVGVNSDAFVERDKGKPPVVTEKERMELIALLPFVASVRLNETPGRTLIEHVKPNLLVVGGDWHDNAYLSRIGMGFDELEALGCGLCYLPRTPAISSTMLRERLTR